MDSKQIIKSYKLWMYDNVCSCLIKWKQFESMSALRKSSLR